MTTPQADVYCKVTVRIEPLDGSPGAEYVIHRAHEIEVSVDEEDDDQIDWNTKVIHSAGRRIVGFDVSMKPQPLPNGEVLSVKQI